MPAHELCLVLAKWRCPSRAQGIQTHPRYAGPLVRSLLALATPTLGEGQGLQQQLRPQTQ